MGIASAKNFEIVSYDSFFYSFYYHSEYFKIIEDNNFTFDENRSLNYNLKLVKNLADKEKNNKLKSQLQKLNFINGLSNGKYVVVVPQTQEEKQDEGKQQNNCVGYYYDNSIISGKNYIYFIKKVENPNRSYITCRYNKERKETIELRGFNNSRVDDEEIIDFINKIDKIINSNSAMLN